MSHPIPDPLTRPIVGPITPDEFTDLVDTINVFGRAARALCNGAANADPVFARCTGYVPAQRAARAGARILDRIDAVHTRIDAGRHQTPDEIEEIRVLLSIWTRRQS